MKPSLPHFQPERVLIIARRYKSNPACIYAHGHGLTCPDNTPSLRRARSRLDAHGRRTSLGSVREIRSSNPAKRFSATERWPLRGSDSFDFYAIIVPGFFNASGFPIFSILSAPSDASIRLFGIASFAYSIFARKCALIRHGSMKKVIAARRDRVDELGREDRREDLLGL